MNLHRKWILHLPAGIGSVSCVQVLGQDRLCLLSVISVGFLEQKRSRMYSTQFNTRL